MPTEEKIQMADEYVKLLVHNADQESTFYG